MGIAYVALNPSIVAYLGLSVKQGVLVTAVLSNSPAARAGPRQSDVITAFDGKPLIDATSLGGHWLRTSRPTR